MPGTLQRCRSTRAAKHRNRILAPAPYHTPHNPAPRPAGKSKYPVKAINVLKAHGKSAAESALLHGYALNMGRAAQGMPRRVPNARIACLDMNLQKARMQMGVQVRRGDRRLEGGAAVLRPCLAA